MACFGDDIKTGQFSIFRSFPALRNPSTLYLLLNQNSLQLDLTLPRKN